ncbi:PREDICTED: prokineticin-1 isoform X2 [Hipposideros armiger]|uniref:Prokineticin-1 n=1 Tax=Hipposideros armiger TaxID=186990 RepID=A0A8B7PTG5_HIPAR|nr:PREDICTED: prokineticin-1 isoform X2 [Hipposideros armiger]
MVKTPVRYRGSVGILTKTLVLPSARAQFSRTGRVSSQFLHPECCRAQLEPRKYLLKHLDGSLEMDSVLRGRNTLQSKEPPEKGFGTGLEWGHTKPRGCSFYHLWPETEDAPEEERTTSCEACERDVQCGAGTCCAISLWLRGLRMCTPLGREGDECHPGSHKIPFFRKRQHHSCPCLPNLLCSRCLDGRYRCSTDLKNINF